MTENLRRTALADLEKNDTVGKLEQEQASSTFKLNHIEQDKVEPQVYTAFGVRTVRTLNSNKESIDQLVEEYPHSAGQRGPLGRESERAACRGVLVEADRG